MYLVRECILFILKQCVWFCIRCAFIRGEYTENVSVSCTEATHPARCYCPSDVKAEVSKDAMYVV